MSICFHLLPLSLLVLPSHLAPSDCGRSGVSMRQPRLIMGQVNSADNWLSFNNPHDDFFNGQDSGGWKQDSSPSLSYDNAFLSVSRRDQARIINGRPSPKGAWPWQVSLQVLHPKYGLISNWCGGVLIESSWVLTAAHCINNDIFNLPLPALWTAVVGEWNKDDSESAIRLPVEKIVLHKDFNNYNYDIALLRLSELPASKAGKVKMKPICLADDGDDPGRVCVATGWGRASKPTTRGSSGISMVLRQVSLPIHNLTLCKEKYGPSLELNDGHLCAGRLDGSTGACIGDSGGPLQCSAEAGKWYLAGITSFGSGCARPGYPDVYTRVSHFLSWINETITKTDKASLYEDEVNDETIQNTTQNNQTST